MIRVAVIALAFSSAALADISVDITKYSNISGCSLEYQGGTPDIGNVSSSGASVEYSVSVASGGTYNLMVPLASMSSFFSLDIYVNGTKVNAINDLSTGSWSTFKNYNASVNLNSGSNLIKFAATWGSQYNMRSFTIVGANASTTTSPTTTPTTTSGSVINVNIAQPSAISNCSVENVGGVYDVGNLSTSGGYVEYQVNASAAGTYQLDFPLASAGGFFTTQINVNGSKVTSIDGLGTGSWSTYKNFSTQLNLNQGNNTIRFIAMWGTQYNLRSFTLTPLNVTTTTPPTTTPTTPTTSGSVVNVDISQPSALSKCSVENNGGVYDIGNLSGTDGYAEFTINAPSSGSYKLEFPLASAGGFFTTQIDVNGSKVTSIDGLGTGSWTTYKTFSTTVNLNQGTNKIRFTALWGTQYNLRSFTLTLQGSTTTTPTTPTCTTANPSMWFSPGSQSGNAGGSVNYTLNLRNEDSGSGCSAVSFAIAFNGLPSGFSGSAASSSLSVNPGATATLALTYTSQSWVGAGNYTMSVSASAGSRTGSATGTYTINAVAPPTTGTVARVASSEIFIDGTSGNDTININQFGSSVVITVNGVAQTLSSGPYAGINVMPNTGSDNVTIESGVSIPTYIMSKNGYATSVNNKTTNATVSFVSVGDGSDPWESLSSVGGSRVVHWAKASDGSTGALTLNRVGSYYGGVSLAANGQDLQDPSGSGWTVKLAYNRLFGGGAVYSDVNQGSEADCFLLAPLAAIAYKMPSRLQDMIVDLGDGSYAVRFKQNGSYNYVRIDGDLPGGPWMGSLNYTHNRGTSYPYGIWASLIEKAYAIARTGAWAYSSLDTGWHGTVWSDLGFTTAGVAIGSGVAQSTFYNSVMSHLNQGHGLTVGTVSSVPGGIPLVGFHVYMIVNATMDGGGNVNVQLYNPWGTDGGGNVDSNTNDGLVWVSYNQLVQAQTGGVIAGY